MFNVLLKTRQLDLCLFIKLVIKSKKLIDLFARVYLVLQFITLSVSLCDLIVLFSRICSKTSQTTT